MRLTLVTLLLWALPGLVRGQAPIPSISPTGAPNPDPVVRLTTTSVVVTFTITNLNGGGDGAMESQCVVAGNVTFVSCQPLTFLGEGQVIARTMTVTTTGAGAGAITYRVRTTSPVGAWVEGTWNETIVAPAGTVTPDAQPLMLGPGLAGQTQVFTVTNTSSAPTTFALSFACPNPGATGCALSQSTISLAASGQSGSSGNVTVTFTTGGQATQGTITVSAAYQSTTVDQGSVTVTVPSATVSPATAGATPLPNATNQQFVFTVTNNGVAQTPYTVAVVCAGASVSGCSVAPTTMTLNQVPLANNNQPATITYTAGATGTTGTATLQVKFGASVLATGVLTVTPSALPPVVNVTPDGGTLVRPPSTASSQTFAVAHTGQVPSTYNLAAVCTPPGAVTVSCPTLSPIIFFTAGSQNVMVNFTSGTAGASGQVTLTATHTTAGINNSGFVDVKVVNASVTPVVPAITAPASTNGLMAAFTVINSGLVPATIDFTAACSGTALTGSCTASPTSIANMPVGGPGSTVNITYNTTAAGTGQVSLTARFAGVNLATGVSTVTVGNQAAPVVNVTAVNPGTRLARGQCLALAIASASASECGDLRIAHPLPTVRAMNTWRTPTLVYNSAHAIGWVSVGANVTMPSSSALPPNVTATLKIGGVSRATGTWPGGQWTSGAVRRIALGFSAQTAGLATGAHEYSLEVTNAFTGNPLTATVVDTVMIVNRSTSYFGAGWWLAGLEVWNPTTAVWIGGDGSARRYHLVVSTPGSRKWGAPSITYPDTLREVGTAFIRHLPDSVWVYFNAAGQHDSTRNRQRHVTKFGYSAGKLASITLPPAVTPTVYTLNHATPGQVSIVAPGVPAARTTVLTIPTATGRLTTIQEPDTRTVSFGYGTDHKITARTDRRGTVTGFQYDIGNRVSRDSIAMGGTVFIKRVLTQAASAGWSGAAVAVNQVYTRLDGPRFTGTTPINTTTFYLNKYHAPDSIVDALGQRTRLGRGNGSFPGLVDTLTTVTGHQVVAGYDTKGRILTSREQAANGLQATTSYQWDPGWDQITRITNPAGDFTQFGVEAATGNRLWQQDGRGSQTRVNFDYNASDQLATITPPAATGDEIFTYDSRGNLLTHRTIRGFLTTFTNSTIGLSTMISSPTGTTGTGSPFKTETITYTKRNEDSVRVMAQGTKSVTVDKTFDGEGNVLTLKRRFSPRAAAIPADGFTTTWTHDKANRVVRQVEPDGSAAGRLLDPAGNVEQDTTRRTCAGTVKCVLTMSYDALNRMLTRTLPAQTYGYAPSQVAPSTPLNSVPYSYQVLADNQTFLYAPDGQVTFAGSRDGSVTRGYHPNGRLLSETLAIKTGPRTGADHLYATGYTYDVNNRRARLVAPAQFTGDSVRYAYDPAWGALTSVTDLAGSFFPFTYNDRGELTGVTYPGNYGQTLGYDQDGRLSSDVIANTGSQAFPFLPVPQLRNFTVTTRDARGLIRASTEPVLSDQVTASYDGLGALTVSAIRQNLSTQTSLPAFYTAVDTFTVDGLGNISRDARRDSIRVIDGVSIATNYVVANYGYNTSGKLTSYGHPVAGTTDYTYNTAGSEIFQATTLSAAVTAERVSYFGPDERLAATDTRSSGQRTFEEYRYDALGRRIWVRSNTQCSPVDAIECITRHVRRTVWDGNQELAELRVPYDTANAAIEEMDTGYPVQPYNINGGVYGDPNPFLGRVVYGPGLGIDQPLSVTRYDYRDNPNGTNSLAWPRFSWQIFWNYQGAAAYGTLTTGAVFYPFQLGGGQTSCPTPGNQTQQRCVLFQWPQLRSAYNQNQGGAYFPAWHGALIQNKRDGSGLEDKRNRAYDPQTGRFTQEDPIGLEGGLNAYAYSGSDPVNTSDPFGQYIIFRGPHSSQLRAALREILRVLRSSSSKKAHAAANEIQWLKSTTLHTVLVTSGSTAKAGSQFGMTERNQDGYAAKVTIGWENGRRAGSQVFFAPGTLFHELSHAYADLTNPDYDSETNATALSRLFGDLTGGCKPPANRMATRAWPDFSGNCSNFGNTFFDREGENFRWSR